MIGSCCASPSSMVIARWESNGVKVAVGAGRVGRAPVTVPAVPSEARSLGQCVLGSIGELLC